MKNIKIINIFVFEACETTYMLNYQQGYRRSGKIVAGVGEVGRYRVVSGDVHLTAHGTVR